MNILSSELQALSFDLKGQPQSITVVLLKFGIVNLISLNVIPAFHIISHKGIKLNL